MHQLLTMGSSFTTALVIATLSAVPPTASAFTLPYTQSSALLMQQRRVVVILSDLPSSASHLDTTTTTEQDEATTTTTTTTTTTHDYDPSDAFTKDEYSDLVDSGLLKKVPTHNGHKVSSSFNDEQPQEEEEEESHQAAVGDIIRDLDGNPLSAEYFGAKMGIKVDQYTCPESDAFRGFMSNGCRIYMQPGGQTAFYKHIVFAQLDHAQEKLQTAPHKLARDAKSYQVVAAFLQSKAVQQLMQHTNGDICIPACYDAEIQPDFSNPMESKFSFLLQDLSPAKGWYQSWLLHDVDEVHAALSAFAKIHAFFWHGSAFWQDADASRELEAAVWESGSYVQPQAQNWNQCHKVAAEWTTKRLRFRKELSNKDYWDNLGQRLESMAEECGRLAHPFADNTAEHDFTALSKHYQKYRTFTHGDPKQANLLFRPNGNKLQVGLLDFQWSGFGLAATDIAHMITSGVHADRLVNGGEEELLRYYHNELTTHLAEYGAFDSKEQAIENYSYDTFLDQYEIGVLDICRLMIAYTWSRFTEPVERDQKAACARTMNKTSYNKSIPVICWLLDRCDEIMKSRGV